MPWSIFEERIKLRRHKFSREIAECMHVLLELVVAQVSLLIIQARLLSSPYETTHSSNASTSEVLEMI